MTSTLPRILLVEDDPVTRTFLVAALEALPATVDAADSLATACTLATPNRHALWLLDANLPDGSGAELLARLRSFDPHIPALAHTATDDAAIREALIRAGFRAVLVKPLPVAALQAAVRGALGQTSGGGDARAAGVDDAAGVGVSIWDDASASRALNGNREHIAALRGLFVAELRVVWERVTSAFHDQDFDGLHAELHRLRASCGFVGAAQLGAATQALDRDMASAECMHDFDAAAQALLERVGQDGTALTIR